MPVTKKPWCAQKILPLNVNKSVSSYKKSSTYNISGVEYFESKLCFKSTKRVQNSFHSVIMLNHQYLWILKKQTCYFDIRYPRNWITFGFQSCWNAKSFGIKRYVFISSLAQTQSYSCLKCVLVEKKCASKTHSKFIKCSHQTIRIFNFHKACTIRRNRPIFSLCDFLCTFFSAGTHLRQLWCDSDGQWVDKDVVNWVIRSTFESFKVVITSRKVHG